MSGTAPPFAITTATGIEARAGEEDRLLEPVWRNLQDVGGVSPVGDHAQDRLLRSANAVTALNERLGLDMASPDNQLARDRLTAFVANVSVRSGVRPDEVVLGSDTDAFVVQNDTAGRSIARFDTRDAMGTPVGDSLQRALDATREQPSTQTANVPVVDQQAVEASTPDLPAPPHLPGRSIG